MPCPRRDPARLSRRTSWSARAPTWSAPTWPTTASWPPARRVFNGARLGRGCQLRINALVCLRTVLPPGTLVPLIAPRERHEDIWAVQRELNFPGYVWGLP
jgi:hypothetical protein